MKQEDKEWLLKDLCMRVPHTPTGDSFCQDFTAIDRILPNHFNYHGLIKKGIVLETTKDTTFNPNELYDMPEEKLRDLFGLP